MSSGSSADLDAKLNKPLGVLIDEEASARRGRGRGRGRGGSGNGSGPARRGRPISQAARANGSARSSSYQQTETRTRSSTGSANSSANSSSSSNAAGRVVGDTIFVSNLSKDITAEDVTDIFSRVGAVKNASVNYNQNGESQGTAEVTFQRKDDAETAVKEYDQAEVEGRVMYVKLVAQFVKAPNVVRRPQNIVQRPAGRAAPRVDTRRSQQTRGGGGAGGSRGARGGRGGRGRGRGGRNGAKPTKEELDADLDNIKSGASAGQPASHSDA